MGSSLSTHPSMDKPSQSKALLTLHKSQDELKTPRKQSQFSRLVSTSKSIAQNQLNFEEPKQEEGENQNNTPLTPNSKSSNDSSSQESDQSPTYKHNKDQINRCSIQFDQGINNSRASLLNIQGCNIQKPLYNSRQSLNYLQYSKQINNYKKESNSSPRNPKQASMNTLVNDQMNQNDIIMGSIHQSVFNNINIIQRNSLKSSDSLKPNQLKMKESCLSLQVDEQNKGVKGTKDVNGFPYLPVYSQEKIKNNNLFNDEADLIFMSRGLKLSGQEEKNKKVIEEGILPNQSQNKQSEEKIKYLSKNNIGVIENAKDKTIIEILNFKEENSLSEASIFKQEIIQSSKYMSSKDSFKKGNIYLIIQDEEPKKLEEKNQLNVISDLFNNNISITDFLISEKSDIQSKINQEKNKKKLIQENSSIQRKTKKKEDGQQQKSFINSTKKSNQYNDKDTSNIIISYSQDWENMRRAGFSQSNLSHLII